MPALQDLLGQDEAARRLEALDRAGRVPHALLLVGPEGSGKATAAAAIAAMLLCRAPDRAPGRACGACGACLKVEARAHADLHVVSAEGRGISIDAVRDAERLLRLRPVEGARKVLVIEDAHRMTIPAQNALLKTLEEPPGASHLVLTTARLRAVLPTVVSRCQRVPFAPLPLSALARLVAERRSLPLDRATLVAGLAGSLGRALTLELEPVLEARDRVAELDARLDAPTPGTAIAALDEAAGFGDDRAEAGERLDLLATWLHDQLVIAAGASRADVVNADRRADLDALAARRGLGRVVARSRAVLEARRLLESPYNFKPQMIAEQLCLVLAGHHPPLRAARA